jgi:hypothetical protein
MAADLFEVLGTSHDEEAEEELNGIETTASTFANLQLTIESLAKGHKKAAIRRLKVVMEQLIAETDVDMSVYGDC